MVWLVPLVVLARPKLVGYLVWQVAEVGYFYAIWAYLITIVAGPGAPGGISAGLYFAAVLARFGAVALLCGLVVREALRPERDVVRVVRCRRSGRRRPRGRPGPLRPARRPAAAGAGSARPLTGQVQHAEHDGDRR